MNKSNAEWIRKTSKPDNSKRPLPPPSMNNNKIDVVLWQFATHIKRAMGGRQVGGGELNHDEAKKELTEYLDSIVERVIGENYQPSELENDSRWAKQIPPSSTCYESKPNAKAINDELYDQRQTYQRIKEEGL